MGKKVLVLGEIRDGVLRNVSFEAIAAAKLIADGGEVVAALFGETIGDESVTMLHYGADRVVKVEHPDLKSYTTDAYQQALLQVLEAEKPDGFVMGHTAQGKDLSPRIAAKLNAGLVSDVVNIEMDGGNAFSRVLFIQEKHLKSSKSMMESYSQPFAQITLAPLEKDESRSGDVNEISVILKIFAQSLKKLSENQQAESICQKQKLLFLADVV